MQNEYGSDASPRAMPNCTCAAGSAATIDHMPTPPMLDSSSATARRNQEYAESVRVSRSGIRICLIQDATHLVQKSADQEPGASFEKMIVPEAANMPPTPWHTEIFAPSTCAAAMPRICRTLSCNAYMPYMPECM